MLRVLGLFVPPLREIAVVLYQWQEPCVSDWSAFEARLRAVRADAAGRRDGDHPRLVARACGDPGGQGGLTPPGTVIRRAFSLD